MVLKIKELREEAEITQSELAAEIKNVQRNISNWENGNSEPDCQSILAIANYFKVPIDRLFGRVFTGDSSAYELDTELHKKIAELSMEQKKSLLVLLNNFTK